VVPVEVAPVDVVAVEVEPVDGVVVDVVPVVVGGTVVVVALVPGALVGGAVAAGGWVAVEGWGAPAPLAGGGACELAGAAGSESLVSETKARTSTTPASTAMRARTAIGARQLGVGTSRVRAAVPQFRHQS
jgi:hypothetical protein